MEKYEKYKDSGIEWIGQIPEHWEVNKFKYLFFEHSGNGFPNELQGRSEGEIPFFKVSDLNKEGITVKSSNNYVSFNDIDKNHWNIVPAKSILTAKIGEALKKNHRKISSLQCVIDNNCLGIEPVDINKKYAFYLLRVIDFDWFINPGAVPSISMEKLRNHFFPISLTPEEQTAIAHFLDRKTAAIDELIADKKHLLELYEEEKTAIINQAVTKGINPNAPMKDSGIEWLGEIPVHWEVKRIRHVAQIFGRIGYRGYKTTDLVSKGEGAITISPSNMKAYNMEFESCSYLSWEKYEESPEIMIQNNDILFVKTGSTYGKVSFVENLPEKATINPQIIVLKQITCNNKYLWYVLKSTNIIYQVEGTVVGGTIPTISQAKINNYEFPIPSNEEQTEIVTFLDNEVKRVDKMISKTNKLIDLLTEYRTALISEVVTGKIKVTE